MPVHGQGQLLDDVNIPPPHNVVVEEIDVWPTRFFQLLLAASEYCVALHEFMVRYFPEDWAPLEAQVAGYARQLIHTAAPVPPPAVQPAGEAAADWRARNAHGVWAVFTYCYFHGLPAAPADGGGTDESRAATRWLHGLVGEAGWRVEGPVYRAASAWAECTLRRLRRCGPGAACSAASAPGEGEQGGLHHDSWPRNDPPGTPGAGGRPRLLPHTPNSTSHRVAPGPSSPSSSTGGWVDLAGLVRPDGSGLGFLVAADVMAAASGAPYERMQAWMRGQYQLQQRLVSESLGSEEPVIDAADPAESQQQRNRLASCALGWELALQQLPLWLSAAAGSVAAAGLEVVVQEQQSRLMMPREMAMPNTLRCLQQLQQQLPAAGMLQALTLALRGLQADPATAGAVQQLQQLLQGAPAMAAALQELEPPQPLAPPTPPQWHP